MTARPMATRGLVAAAVRVPRPCVPSALVSSFGLGGRPRERARPIHPEKHCPLQLELPLPLAVLQQCGRVSRATATTERAMRPLRVALALVLAAGTADGRSHSNSHNNQCRQGAGFCSQWTNHTVNGESRTPSVITHTQLSTVGRTLCLNLRRTARAQSSPRGTAALARGYANSGRRPSASPARSSGRTSTSACKRPLSAAV
jgi:hypothetical protein